MNLDACYYLGYTAKVHGKQGELIIKLDVDHPETYQNLESVLIRMNKKDKSLIPFFLTRADVLNNGTLRIQIEDLNSADEARELVGKETYLPLEALPKLTGNRFYYHEVEGFTVTDTELGPIGTIKQILDFPTQAIFEVINTDEKEILIPITDEIIREVDRATKNITVTTPEGLVNLYLNS
ncbi:MAG: 16S rRNA processing protein RimM [Flavobacteriales bacterium]|nr:16S rRNA processing protein RimM [Flavobacteriales bacterium]